MMSMAVITLAGAALIAGTALLAYHHAAVLRRAAAARLHDEVREKNRRAKELDARVAKNLLGGADMDPTLAGFQKDRSAIHALPTDTPWMWDADDLTKWQQAELAKREADINRKARLVTLLVLVGLALAVTAANAVLYTQWSAAPPVVSPYPPARSTAVPTPSTGPPADPSSASGTPNP